MFTLAPHDEGTGSDPSTTSVFPKNLDWTVLNMLSCVLAFNMAFGGFQIVVLAFI